MGQDKMDISVNYVLKQLNSYGYNLTKTDIQEKVVKLTEGMEGTSETRTKDALKKLLKEHSKFFKKPEKSTQSEMYPQDRFPHGPPGDYPDRRVLPNGQVMWK